MQLYRLITVYKEWVFFRAVTIHGSFWLGTEIGKRKRFLSTYHSTAMQDRSGIGGIWSKDCIVHYYSSISWGARSKVCLQSCAASACFYILYYMTRNACRLSQIFVLKIRVGQSIGISSVEVSIVITKNWPIKELKV